MLKSENTCAVNVTYHLFDSKVSKLPLSSLEGEVGQPRTVDQLLYGGKLKVHENRSYCGIHNVDCSDT